MLQSITIKNYAIINSLEIEFENGFSIITGETGAGKSILLGALSLILGQRADTNVLKDKKKKCVIEGLFNIDKYKLQNFFKKNDIDFEQETTIRREINISGKSRAFINDTPVNLNKLKELSLNLVDIHSQHNNLLLNKFEFQLKIIDTIAKNSKLLNRYKSNYNKYILLKKELNKTLEKSDKLKADYVYYEYQYKQLEDANLNIENQIELEQELKLLNNAEEIKNSLNNALYELSGDDKTVLELLSSVKRHINSISALYNNALEIHNRLDSCYLEIQDISNEIEILESGIEYNPQRLETVNERISIINELQLKHKANDIAELISIKNTYKNKLDSITSYEDSIIELEKEVSAIEEILVKDCKILSENRKNVIPKIEKKIINQLKQLGMPYVSFKVLFEQNDGFTINGTDKINFLFSANGKTDLQEISKVASGGEVSRLMLSIKSLVSKSMTLPTIVFDEIDTGVSGDIADKMGSIMKKMSSDLQLINITHLPQVASKADNHYLIYKTSRKGDVYTNMKLLTYNERVVEIAKMLSGENLTDAALNNAKALLYNKDDKGRLPI